MFGTDANTFRVEDGLFTVSYDGYEEFNEQFGHIFYRDSFSHYRAGSPARQRIIVVSMAQSTFRVRELLHESVAVGLQFTAVYL